MKYLEYELLNATQIKDCILKNKVMLLYFGSIEQHGPHLPVGTDYICIKERVKEIANRSNSIYFSPMKLGYSYNHSGMTGTINLDVDLFIAIIENVCLQLLGQGWNKIIIFSGHNGNWDAIKVATQKIREKFVDGKIVLARGYPKMGDGHNKKRFFRNFDLHAGVVETALINYYKPELLSSDLPDSNNKVPDEIKKIIDKDELDEIDELLISAITPQHTNKISQNGIWGRNNLEDYKKIPVKEAMENYIKFYVYLIKRWEKFYG